MSTLPERNPHGRAISILHAKQREYERRASDSERHRQQAILFLSQAGLTYSQRQAIESRLLHATTETEKYSTWARLLAGSISALEENGTAE